MTTKALLPVIISLLFFSEISYAQCVLTLQPDAINGKDGIVFDIDCNTAYAQSGAGCDTTNYEGVTQGQASSWTYNGTPGNKRTFIEFDLDSLIQAGCTVNNAIFTLTHNASVYYNCGSTSTQVNCDSNAFTVSRIIEPWLSNTITWANQPQVTAVDSGTDYVLVPDNSIPFGGYDINLTEMVNYWLTNPGSNKGMMLSLQSEQYYRRVIYGLSEISNPAMRPKLVLDLDCPGACTNLISGYIYDDVSSDCSQDSGETGLLNWLVKIEPGPMYANTDSNGYYEAVVSNANYTVSQIIPNNHLWDSICPLSPYAYSVTGLTGTDTISNLDFAVHADAYCPDLTVNIGANFLRRCHTEVYHVSYCNNGNMEANNVSIEINFDGMLDPTISTLPWDLPQNGNVYTFQIGTLAPGACGDFAVDAVVSCNAVFGGVYCVEAHILPKFSCIEVLDSTWDKSSLMVEGQCSADSAACFTIYNTGDPGNGDMDGPSTYRIYENGSLAFTDGLQIPGGDSLVICWTANGNTIRFEVDQRPGHPGKSHPNETIENCDSMFMPKLGFQLGLPLDDEDHDVAIDCEEVRSSWDPNDKAVIPQGLYSEGFISEFDNLEYKIRFQNTGNDTAFKVVVIDTIPASLDITSIQTGASSHNYVFRIFGERTAQWTFDNILLPDSNVNEPESHGFVKFKINQMPSNPLGTEIMNEVGIYFDYNPAVITNTTLNTVSDMNFVVLGGLEGEFAGEKDEAYYSLEIFPNPNNGLFTIGFKVNEMQDVILHVTNILGQKVFSETLHGFYGTYRKQIDLKKYSAGIYSIQLISSTSITTKQVILK